MCVCIYIDRYIDTTTMTNHISLLFGEALEEAAVLLALSEARAAGSPSDTVVCEIE